MGAFSDLSVNSLHGMICIQLIKSSQPPKQGSDI